MRHPRSLISSEPRREGDQKPGSGRRARLGAVLGDLGRHPSDPVLRKVREHRHLADELGGGARLVTIVGPPGMGKTRLARQVMAELADRFHCAGGAR
ncbi:MAG TPA: hypothetical protein VGD74_01730 [Vulgatibacter sp.]